MINNLAKVFLIPDDITYITMLLGGNEMSNVLSIEEVMEAVEESMCDLSNPGFCTSCGAYHEGCEPDARGYKCEECGEHKVFGAEEIILMGLV